MTQGPQDVAAALQRLAEMHRQGALNDEEYARAHAELMHGQGAQQPWAGWGTQPSEQPTQFTGGSPGWGAPEEPTQFTGGSPGWGAPEQPAYPGGQPGWGQVPAGGYPTPGYGPGEVPPSYPPPGYGPPPPTQAYPGGQAWGGQPSYPPQPAGRRRRPLLVALVALGVVVVLVAGGVLLYSQVFGKEIILEPAASSGQDPFTNTVVTAPHTPVAPQRRFVPATPAGGGVPSVVGTDVGLYGDFKGQNSCNREQMITYLTADPAKGTAWASVQGIPLAQVPDYIRKLTPAVLRQDTRVTNHGYSGGRATPRQSVLEAGTRVLVDEFGVPRAKCGCGNPLVEPVPTSSLGFSGDTWPGFNKGQLLAITKAPNPVQVLTYTDLDSGNQFDRPIGSDGSSDANTGQVQVRLTWRGKADLDVAVIEPNGNQIYFNARSSSTGGSLDVDANGNCQGSNSDSQVNIENVYWPTGQAPVGTYQAQVTLYDLCGAVSTDFQLRATVGGRVVVDQSGRGDTGATATFSYDG